jgi:hypothetical protein
VNGYKNIYHENELSEAQSMRKFGNSEFMAKPTKKVWYYQLNLDRNLGRYLKTG